MSKIKKIKKANAAIVIPMHKSKLNSNEIISLKRCKEVFKNYQVILAVPEGLDVSVYKKHGKIDKVVFFKEKYFKSEKGYNTLMCISYFYRQFLEFEYILLYQLDTFVFENNLDEWCSMGYDYIGSPWINSNWLEDFFKKRRIFGLFKKHFKLVGNGGLSLRKVKSSNRACKILKPLAYIFKHEDFFWSNLASRFVPKFKIPDVETALKFSFEENPEESFKLNKKKLPFGCHSWEKFGTEFWRPVFKKYGYKI
ncbi:MAG: hypothetical protein KAQ92_02710 [Candidatus Aenigmarchaeota archaeon]|nr:hypothetical protein [Candidatus Aenigmarchaeota archaeon]MCK5268768.1 hypothetical protein [Spirochaetota bacterium]